MARKRQPPPRSGGRGADFDCTSAVESDGPEYRSDSVLNQVCLPVSPEQLAELRWTWWLLRGEGCTLPAEKGVILLEGGRP
jgi:hypothetical protein